MKPMFLSDEEKKALTRGLKECPKAQRADIRAYIDVLALEWGMIEGVLNGFALIVGRDPEDGQLLFKMTPAGARYVEEQLLPQVSGDCAGRELPE